MDQTSATKGDKSDQPFAFAYDSQNLILPLSHSKNSMPMYYLRGLM